MKKYNTRKKNKPQVEKQRGGKERKKKSAKSFFFQGEIIPHKSSKKQLKKEPHWTGRLSFCQGRKALS